jgi:hypothetical protein
MNSLNTAPSASTTAPANASSAPSEVAVTTIVRQQANDASSAIKEGAAEAFDTAKETATTLLAEQKEKLADLLSGYGKALNSAGDRLAEDDGSTLVQPARKAARHLETAAHYLREKSGTAVIHDLGRMARSKPEWFFGGLFVAGLAAARFLKASAPPTPELPARGTFAPAAPHFPAPTTPTTAPSSDES